MCTSYVPKPNKQYDNFCCVIIYNTSTETSRQIVKFPIFLAFRI